MEVFLKRVFDGFLLFLPLTLPYFPLIFLEKCADLHFLGKRLSVPPKTGRFLLLYFFAAAIPQFFATILVIYLFPDFLGYIGLLPWLLLPMMVALLTLYLLNLIERRRFHTEPPQSTLLRRSYGMNKFLTVIFSVLYVSATVWNVSPLLEDFLSPDAALERRAKIIQIALSVGLTLLFTALKYIWQKQICKCGAEQENTAEAEV